MTCLVCGRRPIEKHHIKTRGSGGVDDGWNIMHLDRKCHQEVHQIGIITFIEKYPQVRTYIDSMGWEIIGVNSFKRLVRK